MIGSIFTNLLNRNSIAIVIISAIKREAISVLEIIERNKVRLVASDVIEIARQQSSIERIAEAELRSQSQILVRFHGRFDEIFHRFRIDIDPRDITHIANVILSQHPIDIVLRSRVIEWVQITYSDLSIKTNNDKYQNSG